MFMTTAILRVLEDGESRSLAEIALATGMTTGQVYNIVGYLTAKKFVNSQPVKYSINALGAERAKLERTPKAPPKEPRKPKQPQQPRKPRAIEARRIPVETMVERSVKTNANSVFALGAM